MKTRSFELKAEIEAISLQLRQIEDKKEQLEIDLRWLSHDLAVAEKEYREAYKEELESRRNYVTFESAKSPHPECAARWLRWKKIQQKIISHPCYNYNASHWKKQALLLRLASFASKMMQIENTAAWNARNPAPHLP